MSAALSPTLVEIRDLIQGDHAAMAERIVPLLDQLNPTQNAAGAFGVFVVLSAAVAAEIPRREDRHSSLVLATTDDTPATKCGLDLITALYEDDRRLTIRCLLDLGRDSSFDSDVLFTITMCWRELIAGRAHMTELDLGADS